MPHKLLVRLIVRFSIVISVLMLAAPVLPQCGAYFKPGYRASNKIVPSSFSGNRYDLADWTGDGRSDFWNILTIDPAQQRVLRIYPALAAGGWDWDNPINYTINIPPAQFPSIERPVIRDFDGDGRTDILVTTTANPRQFVLWKNAGDGSMQPGTPSPDTGIPIGYGDVNGDGRLDRLYSQVFSSDEVISYSLMNADGSFGPPVSVLANTAENGVTNSAKMAGDFTGDGKVDIAYFGNVASGRQLRMLINNGDGSFTAGTPTPTSTTGLDVADLNNDGRADVIGRSFGQIVIFSGQANGTFTGTAMNAMNGTNGVPNPRFADLTGDGRLDMINVMTAEYETFINSPAGTFTNNYYPRRLRTDTTVLYKIEDFTGDGKADIIDLTHNARNVWGEEIVDVEANTCQPRGHIRGFNFDGTGPMDLAVWSGATGDWTSTNGDWPSSGQLNTSTFNWGLGSLGDIPSPGDFDGDGKTDYAVFRPSEGTWYIRLSATGAWYVFHFGLAGDIPVPNDYDGGGKTDIAVFRPSDGNWYFWYSETQSFSAFHWGANGDRPVPADFDGDGKNDVAVFRPSTGDWYYNRSSDQNYGQIHWGTTGDIPLPADYDGDGLADLTVFRSGVWHILRSSNGVYQPYYWGTTGDIPVPLFELGEVAFPAVYRPSTSRWYHPKYFFGVVIMPQGSPVLSGLPNG